MDLMDKIARIEQMHSLIKKHATGNRAEFAEKLNTSESTVHRYIQYMRDWGAVIDYNTNRRTYEYRYPVEFRIGFVGLA